MMTKERLEIIRMIADKVLLDSRTESERILASYVLLLIRTLRGPREISEAQAKHIFEAEKHIFTLDGRGKAEKKMILNTLCVDIFGWSPWQGSEGTVYIPSTTTEQRPQ
jgi:hypothetical protein